MHSVSLLQSLLKQKEVKSCLKGSRAVQVHDLNFCLLFGQILMIVTKIPKPNTDLLQKEMFT